MEAEQGALAASAAAGMHAGHSLADAVLSELLAASANGRLSGKLYGEQSTLALVPMHTVAY